MSEEMSTTPETDTLKIRRAAPDDTARIQTLSRLDDRRMPPGPFLLAETGGEIVAARSLSTGAVVADPFRPTSDIVAMLHLRASQMSEPAPRRVRRGSLRYALAG